MNVKYRENIIRINNKEIEMKSKNILELKEVKNMLHIEKINGKNVWEILKLHVSESQKSLSQQMMLVLLKHMLLSQQMDLHFRLVFMIIKLQLGL